MNQHFFDLVESAIGYRPIDQSPLAGGCVGDVSLLTFAQHPDLVAKVDDRQEHPLLIEARMLTYLRDETELLVPEVIYAQGRLLLMEHIQGESRFDQNAELDAARHLAALHGLSDDRFGLPFDTLIGGLPQPNPRTRSWPDFFADHRLRHMADIAQRRARFDQRFRERIEKLCQRLPELLPPDPEPALIHGDIWSGNVLAKDGRITAFLDPAIYFGVDEVELAFIRLFGTFGEPFFRAYRERRPIENAFFDERSELYNLYPLLVHVALFGGSYVAGVDSALRKFGC